MILTSIYFLRHIMTVLNVIVAIFFGRKEGNVLFNDALKNFFYSYMASDLFGRKEGRKCFI